MYNLTKQKAVYPVITRQPYIISRMLRSWTRDVFEYRMFKTKAKARTFEAKAKITTFRHRAVFEVEDSPRGPHPWAEDRVIILDEAADTNSLQRALQVVEILFKKLILRYF